MQPFRVSDGDDPGRDLGGWDEDGNVDIPGTLQVSGGITGPPGGGDVVFAGLVAALLAQTPTALVLTAQAVGDVDPRFSIDGSGTLAWGDGDGAADITIGRYAAGGLEVSGALRFTNGQLLFRSDGSVNLYSNAAGVLRTDDAFEAPGLRLVATGAAAVAGRATLVAGTVTVNTTAVTANSIVLLTAQTTGAAPGTLRVSARTAGTSFTITSTSGTDTSVVGWAIVEPTS